MRRRLRPSVSAALVATLLGGAACGSSRTTLPAAGTASDGLGAPATGTDLALSGDGEAGSTTSAAPGTTVSGWVTAGLKHDLPDGGTLSVSYPRSQVRPPAGVEAAPAGRAYAFISVRFCAGPDAPVPADLAHPGRFVVEVPGEGHVRWAPETPVVRGPTLDPGTTVAAGTCHQAMVNYVIGGEQHIEAIYFDRGDGTLRWAA